MTAVIGTSTIPRLSAAVAPLTMRSIGSAPARLGEGVGLGGRRPGLSLAAGHGGTARSGVPRMASRPDRSVHDLLALAAGAIDDVTVLLPAGGSGSSGGSPAMGPS